VTEASDDSSELRPERPSERGSGVLEGVKVLELATHGFVPSAAAVLADWGADVVKVEHPDGDPLRSIMKAGFVADTGDFDFLVEQLNRNKRGIALDLAVEASRPVLEALLRWADVFITNQLPSPRRRLRLDPEDVWAVNPRLVYARGHGQGQRGPEADHGGFDAVSFWARSGIAQMLTPSASPVLVQQRAGTGDVTTGMHLAGGIAAALFRRERTGRGLTVDVSLLAAACWTLAPDLVSTSILGHDPAPMDQRAVLSNPLVGLYRTGDGRWVMLNMINDVKFWASACTALGLDDLRDDPDYATTEARAAHRQALYDRIRDTIGGQPLAHWAERLAGAGCIWSKAAVPSEVLDDPQVVANGYLPRHPGHPRARLAASSQQFDSEPVVIRRGAPGTGQHTEEVLAELGFGDVEVAALRESGALGSARRPLSPGEA
jgi:crotonobetainyl-CoA:carnitine CoA-transferase CaiB-like acyl-CoA transferase